MKGILNIRLNTRYLVKFDSSISLWPSPDSPWREFVFLLPILVIRKKAYSSFGDIYKVGGLYMPTIISYHGSYPDSSWSIVVQMLGFGFKFSVQTGF